MTDTPNPSDIHGHPIMECANTDHETDWIHTHADGLWVTTVEFCSLVPRCHASYVRPEPTPEPWAGHPIKWCLQHSSLAPVDEDACYVDAAYDNHPALPCRFTVYQPWVDLLAERDEALQVMNEHRCGEQAERAYRRTLRAEAERDEARKELAALRVLDGASAERADDERKAMAQQRDDACAERKQYKRAANEARRQRNQAREALAKVSEAAGRHPECGKYPKGDPIKCGWKLAVQDIRAALEACDE